MQLQLKNKKYKIDIPIGYNGNKRIRHIETFCGGKKEAVLRENELKIQLKNKMLLGSKWGNSKRVFTTNDGYDMHPNTPSKILHNVIKKYGLKRINFHALRNTSISLQISGGIQAQIISKRARHSNVSITHSIYSDFFDSGFKEVFNKMDEFLHVKTI